MVGSLYMLGSLWLHKLPCMRAEQETRRSPRRTRRARLEAADLAQCQFGSLGNIRCVPLFGRRPKGGV